MTTAGTRTGRVPAPPARDGTDPRLTTPTADQREIIVSDRNAPDGEYDEEQLFKDMVTAAMGDEIPHPIDWDSLNATERRDELGHLATWVNATGTVWPLTRAELPPCWYRHESLIRTLSAARDAYLTAYDPTQAASAAADWIHVWDATLLRLARWVATLGCRSAHRAEQPQRWLTDDHEHHTQVFQTWLAADLDARQRHEPHTASTHDAR